MKPVIVILPLLLATSAAAVQSAGAALSPDDARFALDAFLGGETGLTLDVHEVDVNCDGQVTPGDALAIYERYLLGLPAEPWFARHATAASAHPAPRLHLRHRAFAARPGVSARYEVELEIDDVSAFTAFGLHLTYPIDELEFVTLEPGAETEDWIAVEGAAHGPGEVVAGGFNTGPVAATGPLVLVRLVFAVRAREVDGRRITVHTLSDDLAGAEVISDAGSPRAVHPTPVSFGIHQQATGPTGRHPVIRLDVPAGKDPARLRVAVHDAEGRLVRVLADDTRAPGYYDLTWDRTNLSGMEVPPGVYYCRLQTYELVETTRVVID